MAFICLACRTVSGTIAARTNMVKTMMLNPKLLKNIQYNSTRPLTIGLTMTSFQRYPIISIVYALSRTARIPGVWGRPCW